MRHIPEEILLNKIRDLNPHWITGEIDPLVKSFRKRKYFNLFLPLVKATSVNRAVVMMGPRRVGKTVMLRQVIQELIKEGRDPKTLVYIPLDNPLLQNHSLENLIKLYQQIHPDIELERCLIIFDEVQYLNEWSVHLKVLVDNYRTTKFVVSGSAAAALRLSSRESGAGRFTDFKLPPLTFYEFLDLQGLINDNFPILNRNVLISGDVDKLNSIFIDYINYGGYPEAVFDNDIKKNPEQFIRSDIIEKVLLRDLPSLYGIQDIRELSRFFYTLAYQTGNEVTYDGLSIATGIAKNTIKKYLEYLEASFLIKLVYRVDNTAKTFKRVNFFKVYLTNISMYSALFGLITQDDGIGKLVETAIYNQYLHIDENANVIFYSRWKKQGNEGEVDFVFIDNRFKAFSCMEVKWSDKPAVDTRLLKGLIYFCKKNSPIKILVTTRTFIGRKEYNENIKIIFLPSSFVAFNAGKIILNQKEENLIDMLENLQIDDNMSQLALKLD